MIKYKYLNKDSNVLFSISLLWIIGITIHWYVCKGDHAEISLSFGPIDIRFGTSIWWRRIIL